MIERRAKRRQRISMPPLTSKVAPVVNPASSETRYETSAATSSGRPSRPTGMFFSIASIRYGDTDATIGPSIAAGATAFTVTPWGASSVAA